MASELHSRLEYLVNYSSQLIFVSGDTIAEQQRTLESFVFQQSDSTELAFVTAEPSLNITDYRGTLCKQLLGQVVGSYVRPLNELLAGLNHHEGPVLITITQAQHIPDTFLQELWDLVLQSRFANNKQHLNVLLFGDTAWAEEAKQWLPAKNTSTPLLISSQSVSGSHYGSELDRMLAEKRASFEQYRRDKGALTATSARPNRLRSPWLWLGICLLFVSSFVAILGWQYGTSLSTLFAPIDTAANTGEASSPTVQTAVAPPTRTLSVVKQDAAEPDSPVASPQDTARVTAQPRVIDSYSDAIKTIPAASGKGDKSGATTASESTGAAKATNDEAVTANAQNDQDTVQDTTEQGLTTTATTQPVSPASASAPEPPPANSSAVAGSLPIADSRFIEDAGANYWIQLAGMQDAQLAATYLSDNDLYAKVIIYQTRRYGGDWYVILWSAPAPTLEAARQSLAALPEFPGSENAFIKRKAQIAAELN
ncbi:SPOR domain-containing protein [Alteromonas gilva]|uniref:Cell division protein DamX n=1 Tax=Alteromonas gilva TaxID=2987522 RepID=A0ABT5L6W3_9ALTE|nr:cell division protein DamX [Alteromonas gilva]MDC8832116.1 cell division protein DamX [Alteromonas gilva]